MRRRGHGLPVQPDAQRHAGAGCGLDVAQLVADRHGLQQVEIQLGDTSPGYRFKRDTLAVRLAATALERAGHEPSFILAGGGADANVFNERGLECVNLANGMTDIHTPDERIAVADLDGMVDVTLALVESAREVEDAA